MQNFTMEDSKKTNTMVKGGFLTALSIVLTRFFSFILPIAGLPTLRIGFGGIPIKIAGILYGPVIGALTGTAADLIGVLINPMGAFHPGFTLTALLGGLFPGLFFIYYRKKALANDQDWLSYRNIFIMYLVSGIINSVFLNTFWLMNMLGKGFMAIVPARILNTAVQVPLNSFISYSILKQLRKFNIV